MTQQNTVKLLLATLLLPDELLQDESEVKVYSSTIGFFVGWSSVWLRTLSLNFNRAGICVSCFGGREHSLWMRLSVCLSSAFDLLLTRPCSGIRVWGLFLYPKFVDWRRQQQLVGKHFLGLINTDAKNVSRINDVSSNVASVLQFGELFGALGSTPLSGDYPMPVPELDF